ncbi:Myoneurin [Fusarium oxysporum f. sp. albedinis]|nr:Myoneurin [Fusarium oxysporum f. sp. albedinis]
MEGEQQRPGLARINAQHCGLQIGAGKTPPVYLHRPGSSNNYGVQAGYELEPKPDFHSISQCRCRKIPNRRTWAKFTLISWSLPSRI